MKKLFAVLLLSLMICSPATASWWVMMGGAVGSGGSCATQPTAEASIETGNGFTFYGTSLLAGQSFTVPSNSTEVYSIIVNVRGEETESPDSYTLELRVDNDVDLRTVAEGAASEPMAIAEYTYEFDTTGEIEFIFDTRPTLESSTTYYFLIEGAAIAYADRIWLEGRESGDADYANGVLGTDATGNWDWEAAGGTEYDLYFKVIKCD